ncbi:hypothetical protein [Streptomyces sp. NPDC053367]|uniref:hypothetical protein n=1 Tax=Streptomyces sp. NPDC053367 TaxID=3365700 RepID=UPI0037D0F931
MTSTTDTAGHPDVAEISDLTEGLLPPTRSTDVRRHLEECELCADVYASLEEIRGLLGTLPGPSRMPADVAGRIDAALAAEALLNSTAPASEDTERAERSVPTAANSARVSRETSADRPAGNARTATTGPGRKGRRPGSRRRVAVLGAAFTAAALGLGSVLLSSWGGGSPASPDRDEQSSASDTFAAGTLEREVTGLLSTKESLREGSRTPHSLGVEGGPDTGRPRVFQQPVVPDCVQQGIGRKDTALATEEGVYKGREALLVVLPDTSDSSRVSVYIVDARCVEQDSTAKAEVLLKDSYARP